MRWLVGALARVHFFAVRLAASILFSPPYGTLRSYALCVYLGVIVTSLPSPSLAPSLPASLPPHLNCSATTSQWFPEIHQCCPGVPILLVGNKTDLREDPRTIAELAKSSQVLVTGKQGADLAAKIGAVAHLECSAKALQGCKV